jgi:hypothetical protein
MTTMTSTMPSTRNALRVDTRGPTSRKPLPKVQPTPPIRNSSGGRKSIDRTSQHANKVTSQAQMSSSAQTKQEEMDSTLAQLKATLSRFTRSNNRKLVLQTLHNYRYLKCIPLESLPVAPSSQAAWQELETQVCARPLILNQLQLAPTNELTTTLYSLCEKLCTDLPITAASVCSSIIVKINQDSAATDVYFQLNAILGSQELILQQPPSLAHTNNAKVPGNAPKQTPTQLDLYKADGVLHGRLTHRLAVGVFRKSDLSNSKPWFWLTATVMERFNVSTGTSCRQVFVHVPAF